MNSNIANTKLCHIYKDNCKSKQCMFWRYSVGYDEYDPKKLYQDDGYCGLIKEQVWEHLVK
jgi:hypothetical protein